MIHVQRVRLLSPLLSVTRLDQDGDGPPKRVFRRMKGAPEGQVRIAHDLPRWRWALLEARDSLGMRDVSLGTILPTAWFEVPERCLNVYTRNYGSGERRQEERFEAISTGKVLEWRFTVSDRLPPHEDEDIHSRPADIDDLRALLQHIGQHIGMSQWGHGYLFGLFELRPPKDKIEQNESGTEKGRADTDGSGRDAGD